MMPRPSPGWFSRAGLAAAVGLAAAGGAFAQIAAPTSAPASTPKAAVAAASFPKAAVAAASAGGEEGARWPSLKPGQRQVLGPLERDWPTMDAPTKQKWLTIADRFHTLPAKEQNRISERMTEWSRLTPLERGEVRMRYQEARQVPAPDRSARWAAYQKLPADEKQRLLARAAASAPGASAVRWTNAAHDNQAKANVVPNPALALPPRPVSPTMVQASRGATTRLITKPVTPPAHQQTGMPKIAATPEFVNGSTLLPRRGPQAAVTSPIAPGPMPGAGPQLPGQTPTRPPAGPASAPVEPTPAR